MKKRAAEAAIILLFLVLLFMGINAAVNRVEDSTVKIDGEYYHTGTNELSLTLMTEEGLENLSQFTRLKNLKIIPYKAALVNSMLRDDDPAWNETLRQETENTYPDYTDVKDISFVAGLTTLDRLDISYCGAEDLTCLSGLPQLTGLNISYTGVTDLSFLANLDNVSDLVITGVPARDLSPLLEMDGLAAVKLCAGPDNAVVETLREKGVSVTIFEENHVTTEG